MAELFWFQTLYPLPYGRGSLWAFKTLLTPKKKYLRSYGFVGQDRIWIDPWSV